MNQKNKKQKTLIHYLKNTYRIIVALLAIFLFVSLIIQIVWGNNIYYVYLSAGLFISIASTLPFLFLSLFLSKKIYQSLKNCIHKIPRHESVTDHQPTKKDGPNNLMPKLILSIILGAFSFISSKTLVNTILDYPHLDNPIEVVLSRPMLREEHVGKGFLQSTFYSIYGKDEDNNSYKFKFMGSLTFDETPTIIIVKYLPHSQIVIEIIVNK